MAAFLKRVGIFVALFLACVCGCSAPVDKHEHGEGCEQTQDKTCESGAQHVHHAPHGGHLIPLGDHFAHLELVHDREQGRLTLYLLDREAENAVRVAQSEIIVRIMGTDAAAQEAYELKLEPVASALTGERIGDTSEFSVVEPKLKEIESLSGHVVAIEVLGAQHKEVAFPIRGEGRTHEPSH